MQHVAVLRSHNLVRFHPVRRCRHRIVYTQMCCFFFTSAAKVLNSSSPSDNGVVVMLSRPSTDDGSWKHVRKDRGARRGRARPDSGVSSTLPSLASCPSSVVPNTRAPRDTLVREATRVRAVVQKADRPSKLSSSPKRSVDDVVDESTTPFKKQAVQRTTTGSTCQSSASASTALGRPISRAKNAPVSIKCTIADFVRSRMAHLSARQCDVLCIQQRIASLERERAALCGRHTIHARTAMETKIQCLQQDARLLETKEELVSFTNDCVRFLDTYMHLEAAEAVAEAAAISKTVANESAAGSAETRKLSTTRRRYVARPEMRLVSGGRQQSIVVADTFLERNGGASKPVCLQSDDMCSLCGGTLAMDVQADVMVCEVCRSEQMSTLDGDRSGWLGCVDVVNLCASRYRRTVHMIAHIQRFEGCVGSDKITDGLCRKVMQWLANNGVSEDRVTSARVEEALRNMGHSDMVVYKTTITSFITGTHAPCFTPDQRAQLIRMFKDVSAAFETIQKRGEFGTRINFLSYQYVLYKQMGLLDWGRQFQSHFRLLKGNDNLRRQDVLWKGICDEAGLRFVSSV